MKEKYLKLLEDARKAIEAGDVEQAKKLNDEATALKALIDEQERTEEMQRQAEEMKAKQAKLKAEQEKAEQEAREAEIDALATKKAQELIKNLGVQRPAYSDGGAQDNTPTIKMRGPFDDVDPYQLALGYMVMKSARKIGASSGPSLEYRRAVHGKAQEHVAKNGLAPVLRCDNGATATKSMAERPHGLDREIVYHYKSDNMVRKALSVKTDELMGSDVSSAGDEWIPVFYSRELFRLIRNEARVASLFRQMEVEGESFTFPVQSGGVTWYRTPQTDDAAELVYSASFVTSRVSQVSTSNMTLTPAKISAIVLWTGELDEQSLVPTLPFLQQELMDSGRHVLDELILSGDETTGGTNISDYGNGSISTYWRLLILDGLRHKALVDNSGNNARDAGALTAEDFIATKKLMGTNGKYAIRPSDVVWLMDHNLYYKMLSLGEVLTRDKFGETTATIANGMIERIFGSQVLSSDDYGATDSSGYIHNTTGNNTKGSFLCVRPDQGVIGFGRRMKTETSRIARSDSYEIVAHMSLDFTLATLEAVAASYNVTV